MTYRPPTHVTIDACNDRYGLSVYNRFLNYALRETRSSDHAGMREETRMLGLTKMIRLDTSSASYGMCQVGLPRVTGHPAELSQSRYLCLFHANPPAIYLTCSRPSTYFLMGLTGFYS